LASTRGWAKARAGKPTWDGKTCCPASAGLDQSAHAKWAVADRGEGSADGTGRTRARMQLKLPTAPRHPRGFALPNEQSVICRSQIVSGRDDGTRTELERQQWLEM
jgi:hypothetical protein